jgi:hypothetical protein
MKKYKIIITKKSFKGIGESYNKAISYWISLGGTHEVNTLNKLWGTPEIAAEFVLTYSMKTGSFKLIELEPQ